MVSRARVNTLRCDYQADPRSLSATALPLPENERQAAGLHYAAKSTDLNQGLLEWLTRQNYIPSNPASELELPRTERRLPMTPLTIREVEAILIQPDLEDPIGVRDRALLEVLYSTGIRRMEVISLQLDDVLIEKDAIMVRQGKGRKDRVTPIGGRALQ